MRKASFPSLAGLGLVALAAIGSAAAQDVSPHRKAGWWKMDSQMGGRSFARNLCLDATSDIRNNIFKQPGCTMDVQKVAGGYSYKKTCQGEPTTTGTAMGDFNSAYTIIEQRGSVKLTTGAKWIGSCPAGHKADEMWMSR